MTQPEDTLDYKPNEQWFRFPHHLAARLWKFKSFGPLAVYLALLSHTGRDGRCWPGKELLCRETGLSHDSVRKALRYLEKIGLVHVKMRKNHSSMYLIKSTLPPLKKGGQVFHCVHDYASVPPRAKS